MFDFIITILLFSSMEAVSKPLMSYIDPFSLTFARFTLGFIVLFVFSFFTRDLRTLRNIPLRTVGLLAAAGFLNTFFSMTMLQKAVESGTASMAALVFCTNPVFVYLIQLTMKKEKPTFLTTAGLVIALSGITLVIARNGVSFNIGAIYALAAAIAFAIFTLLNKKITKTVSAVNSNVVAFLFGIFFSFVFVSFTGKSLVFTSLFNDKLRLLAFLYLGIIVSGYCYITFLRTIKKFSPLSASVVFLLKPGVASIISFILLRETPTLFFIIGLMLIFTGSIFILWEKQAHTV